VTQEAAVLFADISGTTRLYRTGSSEEGKYHLERCLKRMERSIEGNRGRLSQPASDELSATFASADDAVLAAIDMQRRIEDLPPISGVRLSIRIGVHFGVVGQSAKGIAGSAAQLGRALLSLAGVGQIITCGQSAAMLSRAQRELLQSVDDIALPTSLGECQIYQVQWRPELRSSSPGGTLTPARAGQAEQAPELTLGQRMALRWAGKALLLDERSPKVAIGRDKSCTLMLRGNKASRFHAVIERRGAGDFVLVDDSTNGTYLHTKGGGKVHVHGDTVMLTGDGKLTFGHPIDVDEGEIVDFEIS
jgi:adenylate cyclase